MPTNDERREAAKRIREMYYYGGIKRSVAFYEALNDVIMGQDGFGSFQDIADRLAELIEPEERTCRMHDASWDDGRCTWGCICSECGAKHEHERSGWMNFCPNCGAKVVRE